jgi:hypothetical protein
MDYDDCADSELLPVVANLASLEQLAERANEAHAEVLLTAQNAVEHALAAGRALVEAKRLCRHGHWFAWLADHFRGSKRTAQAYMRLAVHVPLMGVNAQRAAHLQHDQLRCMLTGLTASDVRVHASRAARGKKDASPEVDLQPSEAPEGRYLSSVPHVNAAPDFEHVARSLRRVLAELEPLTGSSSTGTRDYARHLLGRLRFVYDGLATRRAVFKWRVPAKVFAEM